MVWETVRQHPSWPTGCIVLLDAERGMYAARFLSKGVTAYGRTIGQAIAKAIGGVNQVAHLRRVGSPGCR